MAEDCPRSGEPGGAAEAPLEVADIFARFLADCAKAHPLTSAQERVARDIERCRTAALGGHLQYCQDCGHDWPAYNSCRNRHCPKCQGSSQLAWIQGRLKRVLNTHYFHVVFTLPGVLRPLARANPELVYELLFAAASQTLLTLGEDPRHLGGQLGVTAVLHTWARDLQLHPHLHCIVTGGGLSADGSRWFKARSRYLFPARVLADLFRGKFLAGLQAHYDAGRLKFTGTASELAHRIAWNDFKDRLYRTNWVVYAKRPFGGPRQIITYLGRYTHRVAISKSRLVAIEGDRVRFRTRGEKQTSLPGIEFVRRFLLHVLQPGFRKIRHYGLMAPVNVGTRLVQAQALLEPTPSETEPEPVPLELTLPLCQPRCPRCGSTHLGSTYLPLPAVAPTAAGSEARPPPETCQPGAAYA